MSFFAKTTAQNLWKSVTGVSPAGAKRGRGRGLRIKDYSKGQSIGFGRKRLIIPGLETASAVRKSTAKVEYVGEDGEYDEKVKQLRKEMDVKRKFREHPMDRGWSGRRAFGRRAGPPDPHNDIEFDENFDSIVLMLRPLNSMTGTFGRVRRMQALVVTGNKNGLAGFATAIGNDGRSVVRHARNRASQALVQIPRWDNHTVMHDFFSRYYYTTVFVERKPKGYGIRAHRVIKAICQMFGITDLYAKVEGSKYNQINMTKAFFLGLMNQRKYEDMANEKKLHLVELREENYNFPLVLASPVDKVLEDSEVAKNNDNLDFTYFIYNGRIKQVKAKAKPAYVGTPSWQVHLDKLDYVKNRWDTRLLLAAKYGDKKVLDVFPHFRTTAQSFNKPEE